MAVKVKGFTVLIMQWLITGYIKVVPFLTVFNTFVTKLAQDDRYTNILTTDMSSQF